jgi:phosphatidylglycerophosphate synthase
VVVAVLLDVAASPAAPARLTESAEPAAPARLAEPAEPAEPAAPARLAEMAAQLRQAGAGEVRNDPGGDLTGQLDRIAGLARESGTPLLLCATDVLAHPAALLTVLTEPGGGSVALIGPAGGDTARYAAVREERGLVTGAGAAGLPGASGFFLGVLRVGVSDLPALAEAAANLAAEAGERDGRPGPASAVDLLVPALVSAGRRIGACRVRPLVADRVAGEAEADAVRARMAAVDEDAARLRLAIKERDDFFTTYFVSPISPYVVRWAARAGLGPTAVTGISVGLAVVAALAFAWATRPAMIAGAVLLYASFLLDCVDGQLARYTRRFSAFGGWLDTMADRSKEYLVFAGLAVGAERAGLSVWPLAVAAIALQTVRHMTDTWYGALHDEAVTRRQGDGQGPSGGVGSLLGRASERVQADTGSPAYWLKRIVVFPIGERWALIALTAALFDGRVTLIAVLAWAGLAAAYTLALRSLRARSMRVPVLTTVDTGRHRDDGPLARLLGRAGAGLARGLPVLPMTGLAALVSGGLVLGAATGAIESEAAFWVLLAAVAVLLLAGLPAGSAHAGPLDWLIPAALRAAEYLFAVGASAAAGVPLPLLFVLLFALALRHYDLTARMEKRAAMGPGGWDLGWDGRVVILAAGVVAGVATPVAAVLAGYVVVMFCVGVLHAWTGTR